MSVEYLARFTCDKKGCTETALFDGTWEALEEGWSMMPYGWLCLAHSEEWRVAQTSEPTDEDLLS